MKRTVTFEMFKQSFKDMDRDYFSNEGYELLFDIYSRIEKDLGEEIELDPIAICCEWTEYNSVREVLKEYEVDSLDYIEECHELYNSHVLVKGW